MDHSSPTLPITTHLQNVLATSRYACDSLKRLSGGVGNCTCRGQLRRPLDGGEETIIVKHADRDIKLEGCTLTKARGATEQRILAAVAALPDHDKLNVQTPKALHYIPEEHLQVLTDFTGAIDLKTYLLRSPTPLINTAQATAIGQNLGKWTKAFHSWGTSTTDPNATALREELLQNRTSAKLKLEINYGWLLNMVDLFPDILGEDRALFEKLKADVSAYREQTDATKGIIHGDFWTGNILLPDKPLSEEEVPELWVIDWELAQVSSVGYDIGQLFAELYHFTFFRGIAAGLEIIKGFSEGYGPLDREEAFRVVITLAIHIIVIPPSLKRWGSLDQWGDDAQLREGVRFGRDLIRSAVARDVDALSHSPFGFLF